jgi:beta-galactosidase
LSAFDGVVIVGPRSGSKTRDMQIPEALPPGPLQKWLPLKIVQVASLPPGIGASLTWKDKVYPVAIWQEDVESDLDAVSPFMAGGGALYQAGRWHYLAFWPDPAFLIDYIEAVLLELGIKAERLPAQMRMRRRGNLMFAFNTGFEPERAPAPDGTSFLLGGAEIGPCDVAVWKA